MAISWGAWEYSGGNGMRVGIEVSHGAVGHNSTQVTFTFKFYTENQYSYNDSQSLNLGGVEGGSISFTNNAGGSVTYRGSRQWVHTYAANSYGTSPGSNSISATLSGAYNGVTPSKSVTFTIPARPVAAPAAPTGQTLTRVSDAQINLNWTNHPTSGEPYEKLEVSRWTNADQTWAVVNSNVAPTTTGFAFTAVTANRRYYMRVRAWNDAGWSAYAQASPVQTTPAAPSNCTATKSDTTSVTVNWTNGATTTGGYEFTNHLQQSVNGGGWTTISTHAATATSATVTNLNPGSTYKFQIIAQSTVGVTLNSAPAESNTVQLQQPPAAPSGLSATRNSDTSFTLNWTNNSAAGAEYEGLTVQRWDNVSNAWSTVGNLSSTTATLTDTGTVADRKYKWQVRANNSAGSSAWVITSDQFTTPDAPTNVTAKYTGGTDIQVVWTNQVSYSEYGPKVRWYKNNVLQAGEVSLATGATSYTLTNADVLATYKFEVKATSASGLNSAYVASNEVMGAAPPSAPTTLAPNGAVVDLDKAFNLTWAHSPSQDGSGQTKYQIQYRVSGSGTWTLGTETTSTASSNNGQAIRDAFNNGQVVEWQVRTWGIHSTASPWSATATITGSTTPTVAFNAPGATIPVSQINVGWDYFDAEGTAQTDWELVLLDASGLTLEERSANDATTSLTLDTTATDGATYKLRLRVQDASGLWSDWVERTFTAAFVAPAPSTLEAGFDSDSGVIALSLSPTPDDGGATSLPATSVTIERRLYDEESDTYTEWEAIAEGLAPDATVIDPTAPIFNDGQYRAITYSAAPSSHKSVNLIYPPSYENKWLYVSGGPNFNVVCRMWSNIEIEWQASREKVLYHFAGRGLPVMYSGEAQNRSIAVSGLVAAGDGSPPGEWMRLAQQSGPVLLRAPGRRVLGALSEVSIQRVHYGLHKVSFSIQEVSR